MTTEERVWFTGPQDDPYRYRVADPEGIAGGEALVFRARHRDGREVALKQITEAGARQRQRLLEQAEALEELHHPNVVEQLDAFVGPGLFDGPAPSVEDFDLLYLVCAWVEGTTVAALGTPQPAPRALELLEDIAAGIDHLHAHGIVHRDLHPGNVVVAADRAVVIDLAYVRTAAPPAMSVVFGAPGFVPPERLDDPGSADESADRWQVAMLAVQLLLGRPRRRESLAQLQDALAVALGGAVADAQAGADRIVRLLVSDPELRPSIPLERWVAGIRSAVTAPEPSPEPAASRRRWKRSLLVMVPGLLIAAAVISFAATSMPLDPDPTSQPTATGSAVGAGCEIAVGESDARIGLPAARYREIAQLSHDVRACPASIVDAYGTMAVQTFDAESPVGALVSSGPGHSFALTQAQWSSYERIGEGDGARAASLAGPILSVTTTPGSDVLRTAKGELIGVSPTAPHEFRPTGSVRGG